MTIAEKFYIIEKFFRGTSSMTSPHSDCQITAIEEETEYGTTNYLFCIYSKEDVQKWLQMEDEDNGSCRFDDYKIDGITSCLDAPSALSGHDLNELIADFFRLQGEQGAFED